VWTSVPPLFFEPIGIWFRSPPAQKDDLPAKPDKLPEDPDDLSQRQILLAEKSEAEPEVQLVKSVKSDDLPA